MLKPTTQKPYKFKIFGFDIETYSRKNKYLCASLTHQGKSFFYDDKRSLIAFLRNRQIFGRSYICATNLPFDFFGVFFDEKELEKFDMLMGASGLIYAQTYTDGKDFYKRFAHNRERITFIDTLNYAKQSVEDLGKVIGRKKMDKPEFLGQIPKDDAEWKILKDYNINDSMISEEYINFLFRSFHSLGANPKKTIASTSLSLYKNRFLDTKYITQPEHILMDEFKAYFGGNCHAYNRGYIEKRYQWDINSMYPFMMLNALPNPNTWHENRKNSIFYIENYEGISYVKMSVPYSDYPILPFKEKDKGKLLMPYGNFEGFYTNIEIRKAMEEGATVLEVKKNIFFTETCYPFESYVKELYSLKQKYDKENNPMKHVIKLALNSLYGKMGERWFDRTNYIICPELKEIYDCEITDRYGDFVRVKKKGNIVNHSNPAWASYITGYARLYLHSFIKKCSPDYVDTDCLVTTKEFESSDKLGGLKLERYIKRGYIIRPKLYSFVTDKVDEDGHEICVNKAKGMEKIVSSFGFEQMIEDGQLTMDMFVKIKRALRHGLVPNEIIKVTKKINVEDDKRIWSRPFSMQDFQTSRPIEVIDNKLPPIDRKINLNISKIFC